MVLLGAFALLIALAAVAVLLGRSTESPPATGAAKLVPADALVYLNLSTNPARPAVRRALALDRRLPGRPLTAGLSTRLETVLTGSSSGTDFATQIRPWLGNEAAFAVLGTPSSTAGSLLVLDVRSRPRAGAFVDRFAMPAGAYSGVALLRERSGTTLAFVRHYLLVGQRASVQSGIDAALGRTPSLAGSAAYQRAAAPEPPDRVIDVYASADGVQRVLASRSGLLGALGTLLEQPALTGTTLSASPQAGGVRLLVHSALDRALVRIYGSAPAQFTPTLDGVMPAGSTMLLDVKGLAGAAPRVLAAAAGMGIGARIAPLLSRLGAALASEGVDVPKVLSIFSGETAVGLTAPARGGSGPALVIVTRTRHPAATRQLLTQVESALAQLFPPPSNGPGQAAELSDVTVDGVSVHQLSLGPGVALDYAVFRGLVVLSTSLRGVAGVVAHARALPESPGYQAALRDRPDPVTSLLFVNFSQLLSLGEPAGLTQGALPAALRPDLQKIRAVGLASTGGESDTTAELFLQIP